MLSSDFSAQLFSAIFFASCHLLGYSGHHVGLCWAICWPSFWSLHSHRCHGSWGRSWNFWEICARLKTVAASKSPMNVNPKIFLGALMCSQALVTYTFAYCNVYHNLGIPTVTYTRDSNARLVMQLMVSVCAFCEVKGRRGRWCRLGMGGNEWMQSIVAGLDRGLLASANDETLADMAARKLEAAADSVEFPRDLDLLQGRWRLVYSSGFTTGSLGGQRPGPPVGRLLPLTLGQVCVQIFTSCFCYSILHA